MCLCVNICIAIDISIQLYTRYQLKHGLCVSIPNRKDDDDEYRGHFSTVVTPIFPHSLQPHPNIQEFVLGENAERVVRANGGVVGLCAGSHEESAMAAGVKYIHQISSDSLLDGTMGVNGDVEGGGCSAGGVDPKTKDSNKRKHIGSSQKGVNGEVEGGGCSAGGVDPKTNDSKKRKHIGSSQKMAHNAEMLDDDGKMYCLSNENDTPAKISKRYKRVCVDIISLNQNTITDWGAGKKLRKGIKVLLPIASDAGEAWGRVEENMVDSVFVGGVKWSVGDTVNAESKKGIWCLASIATIKTAGTQNIFSVVWADKGIMYF